MTRALVLMTVWLAATAIAAGAQTATVAYTVGFPEPEHHWMQVDIEIANGGTDPIDLRMSRSSPGRYAIHEFAKNIFAIEAVDAAGRDLDVARVDADTWRIGRHGGSLRVTYRIFGDQIDGTYLAIDTTHAHLNMPASLLWVVGHEANPVHITFDPPTDLMWTIATQLFPTDDPRTFTAPNLQYLFDSPVELSAQIGSDFTVQSPDGAGPRMFRLMVHGDASREDVDALARDVERVVQAQAAIFGSIPVFEPGHYTVLLDIVAWADYDAMEHRNSTVVSHPAADLSTTEGRGAVLRSIAHELFHIWNVERIRPADLEPFDFTRANVTCCLWFAEGFTQYYGPLTLVRAGLSNAVPIGSAVAALNAPGRLVRSAVEMSEHATFADAAISNDPHDRSRTFLSYYTQGAALALGLDLTLRVRSDGRLTLDDYMRRLWRRFGAVAPPAPGRVAQTYTLADLQAELAALTGDDTFAASFFERHVTGREAIDYAPLLAAAGYLLEPAAAGRAWTGGVVVEPAPGGLLVGGRAGHLVPFATPAYDAGLDSGDTIVTIDGEPATPERWDALGGQPVGSRHALVIGRRDGRRDEATIVLAADPSLRIVPVESRRPLTEAERAFRQSWLAGS